MEFWAVVGAANSYKSSTIRSLTGAFGTKPVWKMQIQGAPRDIYVETSAPQEGNTKTPTDIITDVSNAPVSGLVIALRHKGTASCAFDADDYLSAFLAAGWILRGILIVSPEPTPGSLAARYPSVTSNAPVMSQPPAASNFIANSVRSAWGF